MGRGVVGRTEGQGRESSTSSREKPKRRHGCPLGGRDAGKVGSGTSPRSRRRKGCRRPGPPASTLSPGVTSLRALDKGCRLLQQRDQKEEDLSPLASAPRSPLLLISQESAHRTQGLVRGSYEASFSCMEAVMGSHPSPNPSQQHTLASRTHSFLIIPSIFLNLTSTGFSIFSLLDYKVCCLVLEYLITRIF